eukprot:3181560-Prymnesium_polylepis.1
MKGKELWPQIGEAIAANSVCTEINFSGCMMNDFAAEQLAEGLKKNKTVASVNLENNSISNVRPGGRWNSRPRLAAPRALPHGPSGPERQRADAWAHACAVPTGRRDRDRASPRRQQGRHAPQPARPEGRALRRHDARRVPQDVRDEHHATQDHLAPRVAPELP